MIRYREPALTAISLMPPAVGALLLFLADLTVDQQNAINAVAVAVAGLVTAALVASDRLAPAILGFAAAILTLLAAYGFALSEAQSTAVMGFLSLLVGAYVRTQVTASVPAHQVGP